MRPFRAVALVAIGIAFWGGMRAAAVRDEVAHRFAPLLSEPHAVADVATQGGTAAQAQPDPGKPTPLTAPHAPEVMVYSYPGVGADPNGSERHLLYRLRAAPVERGEGGRSPADNLPASAIEARARSVPATHVVAIDMPREVPPDMSEAAYQAATRAYAFLRVGERRSAASAFAVALSLDPDHPRAASWRKEQSRLSRWWRSEAYVFQRAADGTLIRTPGLPAASNVLGGGQASSLLAITPNPLGRVPVELQARYAVPQNGFTRADPGRAQAAIGIAVKPLRHVPITLVAERLFRLGSLARNDWQVRGYGGTTRRVRGIDLSLFAEAGVVGRRPDAFAGAQLLAEKPVRLLGQLDLGIGIGAWGAVQRTDRTVDRLDVGPTLRLSHPKAPITLRMDYRARLIGDARPGSGVALTVSSRY